MSTQLLQPSTKKTKIFEDPDHTHIVSETFEKFYQEQKFLDIVLIAAIDNVKVKAHKVIVSAASDYFMGMFSSTLKEANSEEITLQGIDGETLISIIEFIYSGCMILNSETVQNILIAADFLQMKELIDACCGFMSENLDVANCLEIAVFAETLNYNGLAEEAYSMALQNFEDICYDDQFLELNPSQVMKLICLKDELGCSVKEELIFKSIGNWVEYDRPNRKNFVFDLLAEVEFQSLDALFILKNRHSVCTSIECYEMILYWIECHFDLDNKILPELRLNKDRKKKNVILVIPGRSSTDELKTQRYRAQINWWSDFELPSSPVRKECFGVAVINEQLIVVGGKIENDGVQLSSSSVECLHLGTLKWSELPPLQQNRHSCAVIEMNGEIFAIGGSSGSTLLGSVEKYNFLTGSWRFVAPLLQHVRIFEAVVLDGMIYVIDIHKGSMQCYNPSSNKWSFKAFKQGVSRYFSVTAACGYLYAVGGSINGIATNTVERYNSTDNTWSYMDPMETPRVGAKCALLNNRIIACGGRDNDGLTNKVAEYNPRLNEWNTLAPLLSAVDGRSKILSY